MKCLIYNIKNGTMVLKVGTTLNDGLKSLNDLERSF